MKNTIHFKEMKPVPDEKWILHRLGYKKGVTTIDKEHQQLIEKGMQKGLEICKPQGLMRRLTITARDEEKIQLETGDVFYSKHVANILTDSKEIIIMGSTVGSEISRCISTEITEGEIILGLIMDAMASQLADKGLEWMLWNLAIGLSKENKGVTKHRCSPGNADFPISYQKTIYDLIEMDKLDVTLTQSSILIPEKSVIGVAGVVDSL